MRLLKMAMTLLFALVTLNGVAQTDTLMANGYSGRYEWYRDRDLNLLIGAHLQQAARVNGDEYSRKYIELGMHSSIMTPYAVFTHGFSVEFAPEKTPVTGFKYGAWTNIYFVCLGINGIYYSDFRNGCFVIRPEFGIGVSHFKMAIGHNFRTWSVGHLKPLESSDWQLAFAYLLRVRRLKHDSY
jgi:hypothetical protein